MKPKAMIKIVLDLVMSIMLPILMAFILTGQKAHEWIGAAMFVMFITHNLLNFRWYKNLRKGKYTVFRIFQTVVNLSVFICMIGLMVSGIMMSRYPFAFLSIPGGCLLQGIAYACFLLGVYLHVRACRLTLEHDYDDDAQSG